MKEEAHENITSIDVIPPVSKLERSSLKSSISKKRTENEVASEVGNSLMGPYKFSTTTLSMNHILTAVVIFSSSKGFLVGPTVDRSVGLLLGTDVVGFLLGLDDDTTIGIS